MKKVLSIFSLLAIMSITVFVACKKGNDLVTTNKAALHLAARDGQVTINKDYSFLVFDSKGEFDAFEKNVLGKTHGEVKEYLNGLGFSNSLGLITFQNVSNNEIVNETQAGIYSLNNDGIVEIQGVLLKINNQHSEIDNWNYILIMLSSNLNAELYQDLSSGIFKTESMNQIYSDYEIDTDIVSLMNAYSHGLQLGTSAQSNKIFGIHFWSTIMVTDCHHEQGYCNECKQNYRFGFPFGSKYACHTIWD